MNTLLDPTGITDDTGPSSEDPQYMGAMNNYLTAALLDLIYNEYGTITPSFDTVSSVMSSLASTLQTSGLLASGSTDVVSNIISTLSSAPDVSTLISDLNTINNDANSNPDFIDNPILGVTGVAYHSCMLWSQSINPNTEEPPPIIILIVAIAIDIVGGLTGMQAGEGLGFTGSKKWWAIGIGIAVGAAAGTLAAAGAVIGVTPANNPIDPTAITDNGKPGSVEWSNMGSWHNYYAYQALNQVYTWGTSTPDLTTLSDYMNDLATTLEDDSIVPSGTADVVSNIATAITTGPDISTIIGLLNSINTDALSNPDFADTVTLSITTIAYHSSLLLSQVNIASDEDPLSLTNWQMYLAITIGGALNGISSSNDDCFGIVFGSVIGAATFCVVQQY